MGTFNPADALVRVCHEAVPGVLPLDAASWQDHLFTGETLSNEPSEIESESIFNSGQAAPGQPGKIVTDGDINFEVDAEGELKYFANTQRRVDTTNPDTGVYVHRLAPSGLTAVPATLANWISRADDMPQSFRGGRVAELEISLEVDGLLKSRAGMIYSRSDYWSPPVSLVDTGGANSSLPRLRGIPQFSEWDEDDDKDIFFKASDVTGAPTSIKGFVKVGAAASYGAIESEITAGLDDNGDAIFNTLYDSTTGDLIGTRAMPNELHLAATTNWAVGDEYRFDRERGVWSPAYPDVPVFNEIFAYVLIDGVTYCVEQLSIQVTRPLLTEKCIGGRFAKNVYERGSRVVTVSFQRQYTNTKLRKRLETGTPFVLKLEAYSGEEFADGHEHEFFAVAPMCIPKGRTASVESKDSAPEAIEAQAYPDPTNGDGYVDDLTLLIKNSVSSAVAL